MEVNMSDASQKWQCGSCGAEHGDEPAAISCCAQAPELVWQCGECGMTYDEEEAAYACCAKGPSECWKCGACGEVYGDEAGAELCCTEGATKPNLTRPATPEERAANLSLF